MTKLEGMTNEEMSNDRNLAYSSFGLWISFVIRASCFVIFSALILMLMAQIPHAESPSLISKWNVEITFANEEHRSVRFEAQSDGKGTLTRRILNPKPGAPPSLRRQTGAGAKEMRSLSRVRWNLCSATSDATREHWSSKENLKHQT